MSDAAAILADLVVERTRRRRPVVVGIGGGVAVGKSRLAAGLAGALLARGLTTAVVEADGFLLPNAALAARGLSMRKGYPETYDVEAMQAFVDAVRRGAPSVSAPVYSHRTYDVVDERHEIDRPDVLVIEGLHTLGALRERLDLGVYLDASEVDLEAWYVDRFVGLVRDAARDDESFYASFRALPSGDVPVLARRVWHGINLPILREHVAPTALDADVVIRKGADHEVLDVEVRGR